MSKLKDRQFNPEKLWSRDFIFLLIMSFCNFLSMQFITSIVALWVDDLGYASNYTGIFTMCFTLPCIIGCFFWGNLSQKLGRRVLILVGSALFGITSFLLPFTGTLIVALVFLRIVQGFGYSASNNGMNGTQADVIPPERIGEGIGYFGMAQTLTLVIGPAIAIAVFNKWGYTPVFMSMTAMCALVFIGGILIRADIGASAMKATVAVEKTGGQDGYRGIWKCIEKSAIFPSAILIVSMTAFSSVNFYVTTYVADIGVGNASLFFAIYAIAEIIIITFIKKLSDRLPMLNFIIPGAFIGSIGLLILSMASSAFLVLLSGVIVGVGTGMILPITQAEVFRGVSKSRRSMASSTYFIAFDGGMCLGSLAWGYVVAYAGFNTMYKCAAAILAILAVACIFIALARRKKAAVA